MYSPEPGEYAPYYDPYIRLVQDDQVIRALESQLKETATLLQTIPDDKGNYRYANGKWSIKELINHVVDTERIMSYRTLRFARNDEQPLLGFEENDYARFSKADHRSIADLSEEFQFIRRANILLFRTFDEEVLNRRGTANNNPVSVRALLYIIAGHEKHHMNVLRERYLAQ